MIICRTPDQQGYVRLQKKYNVYIDKSELDYIDRFYKNPKKMLRRLLKLLVGPQNLINMVAKGRKSRNLKLRRSIPSDIYEAVESKNNFSSFS